MNKNKTHHVAFLGFNRIQLLDLVGPLEALEIANNRIDGPGYQCFIVSEEDKFTSESRVKVASDYQFSNCPQVDTVFIAGGAGTREPTIRAPAQQWLKRNFDTFQRVVTVCTGVFMVADLPYLQGKEVVTHWAYADLLQKTYPQLRVNQERLYVKQDKFYSSAGILSGIDLALNIIEEDHDASVAVSTAQYLVTYLKRAGHQSQFSEPLKFQSSRNSHIDRMHQWLMDNYPQEVTVEQLAEHIGVSPRHLNRLVRTHFLMSASKYIEHIKLEQSKIYLSQKNIAVEKVADMVGFKSSDSFRRSFRRKYGIVPSTYQLRFSQ
ncbi:GlxA family transcriptional regulator [Marinicella sp. W31]|uniref:GlxA family transcriptional regulator n=1 Tax=Marinicella sp. W31 TaxID=3023713 RepID=UPI0037572C83